LWWIGASYDWFERITPPNFGALKHAIGIEQKGIYRHCAKLLLSAGNATDNDVCTGGHWSSLFWVTSNVG
jgi:hypothetical protein